MIKFKEDFLIKVYDKLKSKDYEKDNDVTLFLLNCGKEIIPPDKVSRDFWVSHYAKEDKIILESIKKLSLDKDDVIVIKIENVTDEIADRIKYYFNQVLNVGNEIIVMKKDDEIEVIKKTS